MDLILLSYAEYFEDISKCSSFIIKEWGEFVLILVANKFKTIWMENNFSLSGQKYFISGSFCLQNLTTAARTAFFSLPSHCPHIALLPESIFVITQELKQSFSLFTLAMSKCQMTRCYQSELYCQSKWNPLVHLEQKQQAVRESQLSSLK